MSQEDNLLKFKLPPNSKILYLEDHRSLDACFNVPTSEREHTVLVHPDYPMIIFYPKLEARSYTEGNGIEIISDCEAEIMFSDGTLFDLSIPSFCSNSFVGWYLVYNLTDDGIS